MLFKNYEELVKNGETSSLKEARKDVLNILNAAINSIDPYNCVKSIFQNKKITLNSKSFNVFDFENVFLVGFGKASIGMTQAVCNSIDIKEGLVITNDPGRKVKSNKVKNMVGSHPIPDEKSILATEKTIELIKKVGEKDLLIVLISGGGSALLCKPRISLEDLQKTTNLLLKSGADIRHINTIRKHLSHVKGGQLVKNTNCTIISLVISDIIGDPLDFIASGPTYPDYTTFDDAKNILKKFELWDKIPLSVKKIIRKGCEKVIAETPKMGDPVFKKVHNFIVANNKIACESAKEKAEQLGYKSTILTTALDGEAKKVGRFLVEKAKNHFTNNDKVLFIAGGETTVNVKGNGKGGRNQEMVLSTIELLKDSDIVFASMGSDGIDGASDAAGAIADQFTIKKASELNLDPDVFLNDNNSYEFFKKIDDLLFTGPTGTNVMDIQVIGRKR